MSEKTSAERMREYRKTHPRNTTNRTVHIPATILFFEKVNKTDKCWLWTGRRANCGYGQFRYQRKLMQAHRFSYLLNGGDIPTKMLVLHKCDVKACVNPNHLYLGDHKQNMKDARERGQWKPTEPKK